MYAVDDIGDAIDVTRDFLTPVDARRLLKLAVIVVFLSGVSFSPSSIPSTDLTSTPGMELMPDEALPGDQAFPTEQQVELAILAAFIGLVAWLVFTVIGSVMEFVLVDALRSGSVTIRSRARRYLWKGLSLFAFRLVLTVVAFASIAIPAYLVVRPIDSIEAIETVSISTLGGLIALAIFVALVYGLISRLTTEFVVPVMLHTDRGLFAGWSRFWRTVRANLGEYVVYVVLATIIDIIAAIGLGIVSVMVLFVVAIPFVLLGLISFLLGPLAIPFLVVIGLAAVVAFLLIGALIRMPVVVYIRYYALLVLGDTDAELDLVPDRRAAVRTGADWDGGDSWAGESSDDSWGSSWDGSDDESGGSTSEGQSGSTADEDESDWEYRD